MSGRLIGSVGYFVACICCGQLAHGLAFDQFFGVMLCVVTAYICGTLYGAGN